jgi:mannose-6-phosphate isomerase-like protein (cupin superfamily)
MLALLLLAAAGSTAPMVEQTDLQPVVKAAEGVTFRELIGRTASGSAKTAQASVALFHLDAGRASAWSHNKVGEESFFVLAGHGTVWTGSRPQDVEPGSFIVIPPDVVRSVRASKGEALEFYALTTPGWSAEDDVHVGAPVGAPD